MHTLFLPFVAELDNKSTAFLYLSLSLQHGKSHESITPLYASCPTWMQITEGSVGKALLIKTRCLTHYNLLLHTRVAKMNSR